MQNLSKQLMSLFLGVMLLFGWGGWGILQKIYPDRIFGWYPYVPVVFTLMGLAMILVLAKNYKKEAKKLVNLYMILKLVKLVVAIVFVLGFYFIIRTDLRAFGIVFASFYAAYIGMEFYIFYSVEKQIKKEQ